ncbi:Uncharacterized protein TCM_018911 [Theobroma cacao]|uniref:Uncharacterized protein n=1 Tax=Theobroma cacao TaxID=3641 RepID=A0A061EFS9_THECC|nr:Uncharacterized protein TCM_018911 [Theobroma cacao]
MEVIVGRGLTLGAVITLMILLDVSRIRAIGASLTEFNGSGRFATIAANMELEFLMDSEIGRMLASENQYVTESTRDPQNPAANCGRGKPYRSCIPPVNKDQKVQEKCSTYKRGCPTPSR